MFFRALMVLCLTAICSASATPHKRLSISNRPRCLIVYVAAAIGCSNCDPQISEIHSDKDLECEGGGTAGSITTSGFEPGAGECNPNNGCSVSSHCSVEGTITINLACQTELWVDGNGQSSNCERKTAATPFSVSLVALCKKDAGGGTGLCAADVAASHHIKVYSAKDCPAGKLIGELQIQLGCACCEAL